MSQSKKIPTYSLDSFNSLSDLGLPYKIEVFDANRHFEVQYPHRHDFFEVLFLTKGSGIHVIDNNDYRIDPPCVFFLSPGQTHKLELSKDIEGYIFLFTAEFYLLDRSNKNRLLEFPFFFNIHLKNPPLFLVNHEDVQFLTTLFERGCFIEPTAGSRDFANSLLDIILSTCDRLYPSDERMVEKGKGHLLVKRFRELIEEKYHENWSVREYADHLNITENHLTHAVKELTGKTSKGLIVDKQVLEIKRLLKHTDLSVQEISLELGFSDQSYFSKFFKKNTGHTPHRYRLESLKST